MNGVFFSRIRTHLLSFSLLFGIIYNVNFQVLPMATLGRLAVAYLLWEQRREIAEKLRLLATAHPYLLLVFTALFAHASIGYLAGGREDGTQMSRQFHFVFYSIVAAYLYASHLKGDARAFIRNFSLATAVQGGLIIYSLFSPEYRQWLADLVVNNSNVSLTSSTRPPGFTTSSGAALSVIQSLGVFAGLHIAFGSGPWWARFSGSLAALVTVVSTLLVGRTGLMLSAVFLAAFCARDLLRLRFLSTAVAVATLALVAFQGPALVDHLMQNRTDNLPNFRRISEWAFEFFLKEGDVYSVYDLQHMPIPSLGFDTLVGTGVVENGSGNDSGYVQNYYALGLLMSILFYGAFLFLCARMFLASRERLLAFALVAGVFLIEAKEPFIFKYVYAFFLMAHYYLDTGMASDTDGEKHDQLSAQ